MHIPDCPVCVDKSRPRLHLPERHAEWRNCRQCYMDLVNKVGYKCPTRCTVGKLFCTQLAVIVSGYIAITSCLSHSFFFTFLPLFALVGGGALGMLVSYTEMRIVKPFSYLRMVFLTIFVLFAKLKAQFLDSLTKNLQENANLCIQKSYCFCARALFQKFVSPHTNSSGGKVVN